MSLQAENYNDVETDDNDEEITPFVSEEYHCQRCDIRFVPTSSFRKLCQDCVGMEPLIKEYVRQESRKTRASRTRKGGGAV